MKNYQLLEMLDKEFSDVLKWKVEFDNSNETEILVTEKLVTGGEMYLGLGITINKETGKLDLDIESANGRVFKSVKQTEEIDVLRQYINDYLTARKLVVNMFTNKKLDPVNFMELSKICGDRYEEIIFYEDMVSLSKEGFKFDLNIKLTSRHYRLANLFQDPSVFRFKLYDKKKDLEFILLPSDEKKDKNNNVLPEPYSLDTIGLQYEVMDNQYKIKINENMHLIIVPRNKNNIYVLNKGEIVGLGSFSKKKTMRLLNKLLISSEYPVDAQFAGYLLMKKVMKKYRIEVTPSVKGVMFTGRNFFNQVPSNLIISRDTLNNDFIKCIKLIDHLTR